MHLWSPVSILTFFVHGSIFWSPISLMPCFGHGSIFIQLISAQKNIKNGQDKWERIVRVPFAFMDSRIGNRPIYDTDWITFRGSWTRNPPNPWLLTNWTKHELRFFCITQAFYFLFFFIKMILDNFFNRVKKKI